MRKRAQPSGRKEAGKKRKVKGAEERGANAAVKSKRDEEILSEALI